MVYAVFEKINKIEKSKLTKKKREVKLKSGMKEGIIILDLREIYRIVWECYEL